jgi:arginyl-tRNA synthetase
MRQAVEKSVQQVDFDSIDATLLKEPEEIGLLKSMAMFPTLVESSAAELAPHRVIFYLMELAGQVHSYYNKHKVITEDIGLSQARLCLVDALRTVLGNGLRFVGLNAPETM